MSSIPGRMGPSVSASAVNLALASPGLRAATLTGTRVLQQGLKVLQPRLPQRSTSQLLGSSLPSPLVQRTNSTHHQIRSVIHHNEQVLKNASRPRPKQSKPVEHKPTLSPEKIKAYIEDCERKELKSKEIQIIENVKGVFREIGLNIAIDKVGEPLVCLGITYLAHKYNMVSNADESEDKMVPREA